jgi:uncharacterized protein (TIGR03086 family)
MPYESSVIVPLPADETFALITQPERLRRWNNIAARIDLRAGGDYRWNIIPGSYTVGYVRDVEPGKRLVLGWGPELADVNEPDPSTVTITLEPVADGTRVHLRHDGLPEELEASHASGWDHYLARLMTAGATGDAGPDNWVTEIGRADELTELKAAEASLGIIEGVLRDLTAADLTKPSPCEGFTIADVIDHLSDSIVGIGGAGGAELTKSPTDDPEADIANLSQPALEAWHARGTDGEIDGGGGPMPAGDLLGILAVEYLVHAWDVATSLGQKLEVDEALSAYVLTLCQRVVPPEARRPGFFDPEIEVGEGATELERLIAFTGRAA